MRFRKKPVVIDAFQLTEAVYSDPEQWPEWFSKPFGSPTRGSQLYVFLDDGVVFVRTLEGYLRADVGDWIIKEILNPLSMYPCKPDIFQETYDPVELKHSA